MSELKDRMAVVGWHNQDDQRDYNYAVFRWMDEATREIEQLRREVASLERVLQSRTEQLRARKSRGGILDLLREALASKLSGSAGIAVQGRYDGSGWYGPQEGGATDCGWSGC